MQRGSGNLQCPELYFPLIGNRRLVMSSAVDDSSVETTIEMGNQRQSKCGRKFTGVSNRELVEEVQDQGILIGNRERAKACMLTRYWLLDGELSGRVRWGNLEAAGGTALVADLVESVAALGVSTERVLHRGTVGVWVRCPACIAASGVIRGSRTLRKQQTRPFAMASTSRGNRALEFCAGGSL